YPPATNVWFHSFSVTSHTSDHATIPPTVRTGDLFFPLQSKLAFRASKVPLFPEPKDIHAVASALRIWPVDPPFRGLRYHTEAAPVRAGFAGREFRLPAVLDWPVRLKGETDVLTERSSASGPKSLCTTTCATPKILSSPQTPSFLSNSLNQIVK